MRGLRSPHAGWSFNSRFLVNNSCEPPGGGSQVWQGKDLRSNDFKSVARKGLTNELFGCVANAGVMGGLRSLDSQCSLRTRILIGCSIIGILFGCVARKRLSDP